MSLDETQFTKLSLEEQEEKETDEGLRVTVPLPSTAEALTEIEAHDFATAANDVLRELDNQFVIKVDPDKDSVKLDQEGASKKNESQEISHAAAASAPSQSRSSSLGFRDDLFAFIDDPRVNDDDLTTGQEVVPDQTMETLVTDLDAEVNLVTEQNTENECPEISEGRASELEYNFLDESDRSCGSEVAIICKADMPPADTPAASPKSEGRAGKARAPLPPVDGEHRQRSASFSDNTCAAGHVHRPACPSALVKYHYNHPHKIRFLQLSYNTNLRKPTENWLRVHKHANKHSDRNSSKRDFGSSFWSYPFEKSSSWSMFSSFRYGSSSYGRRINKYDRSSHNQRSSSHYRALTMHDFDRTNCLCCDCCNCSQTNQTCCCCCFHCVHMTSSCRRSDLLRLVPVSGSGPPPSSILKKPKKDKKQTRKRVAPSEPDAIKAGGEMIQGVKDGVELVVGGGIAAGHVHADSGDEPVSSGGEQKAPIKERGV